MKKKKMKKWLNAVIHYLDTGTASTCPECSGGDLSVHIIRHKGTVRGAVLLSCALCGRNEHFSSFDVSNLEDVP